MNHLIAIPKLAQRLGVDARTAEEVARDAAALRPWDLRWAWPRDGRNETLAGAGVSLAKQAQGLEMMADHAQFDDGGVSVGIMDMLTRMPRLKSSGCAGSCAIRSRR